MTEFNIKSSTIEKGLDLVKGFLERAIGPSVDEFGFMHQDNMRFRRANNQLKIFTRAKERAEKTGMNIKQMNLKALFPLLEGISLEEEETLQEMWTNLFLNYTDSSKNLTINVYPEILKQLSTNEVRLLEYVKGNDSKIVTGGFNKTTAVEFGDEEIANLRRLGLIEEVPNMSYRIEDIYEERPKIKTELLSPYEYFLSDFGHDFLRACSR